MDKAEGEFVSKDGKWRTHKKKKKNSRKKSLNLIQPIHISKIEGTKRTELAV